MLIIKGKLKYIFFLQCAIAFQVLRKGTEVEIIKSTYYFYDDYYYNRINHFLFLTTKTEKFIDDRGWVIKSREQLIFVCNFTKSLY
jgi:hypothetical protein